MIADSGPRPLVRWPTPFGWTELVRPFTENDAWPLLPAVAATVVLGITAAVLASRRDAGDGWLASRAMRPPSAPSASVPRSGWPPGSSSP